MYHKHTNLYTVIITNSSANNVNKGNNKCATDNNGAADADTNANANIAATEQQIESGQDGRCCLASSWGATKTTC